MNVASFLSGTSRQLDRKVAADEIVTPEDAGDTAKLAKLLTRLLKSIATLGQRPALRRTDYEDKDVDASGTVKHRFAHGFGGRVRWWVVDANAVPALVKDGSTDANTLVLTSAVACRITLRVEEAG